MKSMKAVLVVLSALTLVSAAWAGASAEAIGGSSRSVYLSSRGAIMPAKEIQETSFIAAVDYGYPQPEGAVGVSAHTGHRQVLSRGQEELVVIGLQGSRVPFKELPPLNLAFVIDKSGSMAEADKLVWVKESFDIFVEQVRDDDFVSLIAFDSAARVVFPSTRIGGRRERFQDAVRGLSAGGGTDIKAGVELGYQQVLANLREGYVNWVLLLTDGQSDSRGLYEMAESYRSMGVGISTIGLGQSFNMDLMHTLARRGGGSSRFVADRKRMVEIFGTGLSRMIVPAARDVEVAIELARGVRCLEAWAPDAEIRGRSVSCRYPIVQTGDYETIVLKLELPPMEAGEAVIGRVRAAASRGREPAGEVDIRVQVVDKAAVDGASDAIVLRAGTMLRYAQTLKQVGARYYEAMAAGAGKPAASGAAWARGAKAAAVVEDLIEVTNAMKKEVLNTRERLDDVGFDDELKVLDAYLEILGGDAQMEPGELARVRADREIAPAAPQVPLMDRLEGLFGELVIDVRRRGSGRPTSVAVSGFGRSDGRSCPFTGLLDELAATSLSGGVTLVERGRIEAVLAEQQLSASDLVETGRAIRVGRFLAADYILTGTVVPMQASVVVFCRLINTTSAEVESAAQVIMPMDADMRALL